MTLMQLEHLEGDIAHLMVIEVFVCDEKAFEVVEGHDELLLAVLDQLVAVLEDWAAEHLVETPRYQEGDVGANYFLPEAILSYCLYNIELILALVHDGVSFL